MVKQLKAKLAKSGTVIKIKPSTQNQRDFDDCLDTKNLKTIDE